MQAAIEKAKKISKIKSKKAELATLHQELATLKELEEAMRAPLARLDKLLNSQLECQTNESIEDDASEAKIDASKLISRIMACNGTADDDLTTVGTGITTLKSIKTQRTGGEEEDGEVHESTFDRILDVACG